MGSCPHGQKHWILIRWMLLIGERRGRAMTGFYGGDTEQMRAQAQACELGSQRIHEVTDALGAVIDSVPWFGPDAIALRALWHGTVKPGMIAKAEHIRTKGIELDQHATEQDRTSAPIDAAGIIDTIRGGLGNLFPRPIVPGLPLTPEMLGNLGNSLGGLLPEHRPTGDDQYIYGGEGYGRGNAAGDERLIGNQGERQTAWDGRELSGEHGYLDVHGSVTGNAGGNVTTDPFGNVTATGGLRGAMEMGAEGQWDLASGGNVAFDAVAGKEVYLEGGMTTGPDGISGALGAGTGTYGEVNASFNSASGASAELGAEGFMGADANLHGYAHATRNDHGDINGFTFGGGGEAFAGAEGELSFSATSPGGWITVAGDVKGQTGAGMDGSFGGTVSTDEISLNFDASGALGFGGGGAIDVSISPNAIVESITPGDYNLDDMITDGRAWVGNGMDWLRERSPF